eukprot:5603333-Amphidinium_carterae.1
MVANAFNSNGGAEAHWPRVTLDGNLAHFASAIGLGAQPPQPIANERKHEKYCKEPHWHELPCSVFKLRQVSKQRFIKIPCNRVHKLIADVKSWPNIHRVDPASKNTT